MTSTLRRGYIRTNTRRIPSPSTCTDTDLCNRDHGSHWTTSTVITTPPPGGRSAAVGRTLKWTPTQTRRESQERGVSWARKNN